MAKKYVYSYVHNGTRYAGEETGSSKSAVVTSVQNRATEHSVTISEVTAYENEQEYVDSVSQ